MNEILRELNNANPIKQSGMVSATPHYIFYSEIYGGIMPEADFNRLSRRGEDYINACTFGRAKGYEDTENLVKKARCALADVYFKFENGGGIAAEKVGNLSVNYIAGISNSETLPQALNAAITEYLGVTGLLYRGV